MSQDKNFSRHQSYNNRFRTSSSGGDGVAAVSGHQKVTAASSDPNPLGHGSTLSQLPLQHQISLEHTAQGSQPQRTSTSQDQSRKYSEVTSPDNPNSPETASAAGQTDTGEQNVDDTGVPKPLAPGKPRRLSRKISAGTKRKNFATARSISGAAGSHSTSADSNGDDVFVELDVEAANRQHGLYDSSLFTSTKCREQILSTSSSTAPVLPNPYNRFNHCVHDTVWFCNCLYFVFFCCLPAVHFMEQSDVQFQLNEHKRARRLGTVSTLLFFVGTILTFVFFGLIFFLAIYFTTH